MKKFSLVFIILIVISIFAGCNNIAVNNDDMASKISTTSQKNSPNGQDTNQTNGAKEKEQVKKMVSLNITVNNSVFTATLEDNDTAKAIIKQLPLTVDMSELNGNEKYHYFSTNLNENEATCPGRINEGDVMLYDKRYIVLFYNKFDTAYSYVKLAHIDNTKGLAEALGSGSVKVTFSVGE